MRAVWYDLQGPPAEVLTSGEIPTPEPGTGELRVRLHASGVNPSDCNRRRGGSGAMEFPRVITHSDGAGVVDQVGPGVAESWLGRRVWLYNGQRNGRWMGTAAEFISIAADLVTPLPDRVSFAEGATLGIPCMTAHRCLFIAGPVQGRVVLVTGAAGAVGHYAVQLAKWAGATVIGTVSSAAKAERTRAAGADHVIDYRREDLAARLLEITGGVGVDHVVEVDFGGNMAAVLPGLRDGASVAIYASNGNRTPAVPVHTLMFRNISLHPMILPTSPPEARRRAQSDILSWTGTGERLLSVAARFSLGETVAAHEAVERGDKVGTVVVEPTS
jgi:NADPH2:quinone reductase